MSLYDCRRVHNPAFACIYGSGNNDRVDESSDGYEESRLCADQSDRFLVGSLNGLFEICQIYILPYLARGRYAHEQ